MRGDKIESLCPRCIFQCLALLGPSFACSHCPELWDEPMACFVIVVAPRRKMNFFPSVHSAKCAEHRVQTCPHPSFMLFQPLSGLIWRASLAKAPQLPSVPQSKFKKGSSSQIKEWRAQEKRTHEKKNPPRKRRKN